MFEDGKEVEEISKWVCQLEDRLEKFIEGREVLGTIIKNFRIAEEERSRRKETELEQIKL